MLTEVVQKSCVRVVVVYRRRTRGQAVQCFQRNGSLHAVPCWQATLIITSDHSNSVSIMRVRNIACAAAQAKFIRLKLHVHSGSPNSKVRRFCKTHVTVVMLEGITVVNGRICGSAMLSGEGLYIFYWICYQH